MLERRINAQSKSERAVDPDEHIPERDCKGASGDNIANHMGFIFALALYDKFDLTFKQITNYYTKTVNKRVAWHDE